MNICYKAVSAVVAAALVFALACAPAYAEEEICTDAELPSAAEETEVTAECDNEYFLQEFPLEVMSVSAGAPSARALYLSDGSLHFVYAQDEYSAGCAYGERTVAAVYDVPLSCGGKVPWADIAPSVTGAVIENSFSGYHGITDISFWFNGMSSASYVTGTGYIDISDVTDMRNMFCGCGISEIDLSAWNTAGVKYFDHMFESCTALVTVYAGSGWSTAGYVSYSNMFSGCKKLKGGNGTAYKSTKKHGNMAVIDAPGSPGYLTRKVSDFSVTVPSSMPLARGADGTVTGGNLVFVNNGTSDARITGITVTGKNGWSVVSYGHDMTGEAADTRIAGFDIGGAVTDAEGKITFDPGYFPVIGGASSAVHSVSVPYSAVMPRGTVSGTETIAEAVFTVSAG